MIKGATDESEILDHLMSVDTTMVLAENDDEHNLWTTLFTGEARRKWIDLSENTSSPPDFCSDELGYMMEVFRIDDNAYGKKGRRNPEKQAEGLLKKQLEPLLTEGQKLMISGASGQKLTSEELEAFKEVARTGHTILFEGSGSSLPTERHHNFARYTENFSRIVGQHIRKIPTYKTNHPNLKLVFLIMDEATSYVDCHDDAEAQHEGDIRPIWPKRDLHFPYLDKTMIDVLTEADLDYVVWFMPYKVVQTATGMQEILPNVAVLNRSRFVSGLYRYIDYSSRNMRSVEV